MKNITIALDDETYRKARIVAAQRDASVSALVKKFLLSLTAETVVPRDLKQEQETLLDSLWQRHPDFTAAENLSRDALHERP
jgi:antitoxin component of RelBE/YafQ-DinJ toxin-antitoxin module